MPVVLDIVDEICQGALLKGGRDGAGDRGEDGRVHVGVGDA